MPALSPSGQDLRLRSLPSGLTDLVWGKDGNPVFDNSETYRVTTLLVSLLGQWWADATGRRGSRLHQVKNDRKSLTVSQVESYCLQALEPAGPSGGGYISDVTARATRLGSGRFQVVVSYKSRTGQTETMTYALET